MERERRGPLASGPGRGSLTRPPVLELAGVTKTFGRTAALRGVDVSFRPGEIRAIVGENGAGKSTLLGVIAGFIRPERPSEVRVDGIALDLDAHSPRAARDLGIAIVPQELAAIEPMSVAENIFLGREPRRGPFLRRAEMRRRAAEVLARLGSSVAPDAPVERLSVAQRQLVEIAKAIAHESRFLALDEPSAVLAGDELDRLFRVIHQLASDGVAIAYVSHRLDEIFAHCDRYTVLKDGQVVSDGAVADVDRPGLVRMMVGRPVTDSFPERSTSAGEVRLRVTDLSVRGKVDRASFEVRGGEIVGIAGLMGSGRTTLAQAIFGALPAASGRVEVDGRIGPLASPRAALRAGIAYLPEDRRRDGLAIGKRVSENITLLALGALRHARLPIVSTRGERDLVRQAIDRLAIRTAIDGSDVAGRLSGGNQQKVVLGKWLQVAPSVLILDEPTRGIDVGTKEEIYRLLRSLARDGLAIVVISSELIEVLGLSDRIIVMAQGRVAGELRGGVATEEDVMRLATGGRADVIAA